jgi:hypothetical protein
VGETAGGRDDRHDRRHFGVELTRKLRDSDDTSRPTWCCLHRLGPGTAHWTRPVAVFRCVEETTNHSLTARAPLAELLTAVRAWSELPHHD